MTSMNTRVVVGGAGPAGLTVANLLRKQGIDCVLLETESRACIEERPRAGYLEEWAVRALERHGPADRLVRQAERQGAFEFRFDGARHTFRYAELSGNHHFVYPRQELVTDLVGLFADAGGDARFGGHLQAGPAPCRLLGGSVKGSYGGDRAVDSGDHMTCPDGCCPLCRGVSGRRRRRPVPRSGAARRG